MDKYDHRKIVVKWIELHHRRDSDGHGRRWNNGFVCEGIIVDFLILIEHSKHAQFDRLSSTVERETRAHHHTSMVDIISEMQMCNLKPSLFQKVSKSTNIMRIAKWQHQKTPNHDDTICSIRCITSCYSAYNLRIRRLHTSIVEQPSSSFTSSFLVVNILWRYIFLTHPLYFGHRYCCCGCCCLRRQ